MLGLIRPRLGQRKDMLISRFVSKLLVEFRRMQNLLFCVLICMSVPAFGKTLSDWYSQGIIPAVSYYYDIEAWAARTTNCVGTDSMACMACSMPMADALTAAGVAPIGVSNDWWFSPERSATCGMCMKVYMYDTPALGQQAGTNPMKSTVTEPWAYSANVSYDPDVGAYYFIAVVVEWFDRYQSSGLDITYPIFQQRDTIGQFGVWNVGLEPVPCPVGDSGLSLSFMDYSKPYPVRSDSGWDADDSAGILPSGVEESLCDNRYDGPCGTIVHEPDKNPVGWPKLKVWGSRYPIGDVTLLFNGQEYAMRRSVDDFWEPGSDGNPGLSVSDTVTVRIQCLDGPSAWTEETEIVAGECLCMYQDPDCQPCITDVQC